MLNVDAFVAQAKAYDAASQGSTVGRQIRRSQEQAATHPLPVLRVRELERWAASAEYARLVGLRGKDVELHAARKLSQSLA